MDELIVGDALEVLKTMPGGIVQTCVTSPPYYGLRDYGVDGQIGLEPSAGHYIDRLVEVFREVKRVLKDDGTLWVNMGDTYANRVSGSALKPKDLIGIPWMLAFALRADGWWLRQDIIWAKKNCIPESVTDRCVKSHEYIFLLSKSRKYYFDHEAIREPVAASTIERVSQNVAEQAGSTRQPKHDKPMKPALPQYGGKKYTETPDVFNRTKSGGMYDLRPVRNKRDVWFVANKPHKEAHFAMFPEKLIEPCILAGAREGDLVLDPFCGGGTTGIVAKQHGRRFVGIELNPAYVEIARERMEKAGVMDETFG